MAFCEFSNEVINKNSITLDNIFITEFMPNASDNCLKVYLYGLYLCGNSKENSIDNFEKFLDMSKEDIVTIFYYWQEKGLVQVLNIEPIQVRYLPIKNAMQKLKKYNVDKYTAFNISAQELIGSKMLTPREFEEFYYVIENLHVEKEAMLKIINFCVKQKGKNISVNYIVAVAKNWAYDGVRTSEDVDLRIDDQERLSGDITLVLKAMSLKRQATIEEFNLFLIWTKEMELAPEIIVQIAKKSKSKTFAKLNEFVLKCYSNKIESVKEINDYFDSREKCFSLAKNVVKNLGLWYDDLTQVVDTYVSTWLQLGFEEDAILKLSNYAFKSSIRTLEAFNNNMNNMFKLGVLTSQSIDNYMNDIVKNDKVIAEILEKLDISRNVNSNDRTFYKTWIFDWDMSQELIDYAVELSKGKYMPMQYLNKILSEYRVNKITNVDDAKKLGNNIVAPKTENATKSAKQAPKREYSKKELDSFFDNIYEVEI